MFNSDIYTHRRQTLLQNMQQGIAIIPTAPEALRNGDAHYPYRYDSNFYYLTGFIEPDAVLVLIAGDSPQSILFCREKNLEREIWDGHRCGPEAAIKKFNVNHAYSITHLDEKLLELISNQSTLYYPIGVSHEWDTRLIRLRTAVQAQSRTGVYAPDHFKDISKLLHEMRLFKDSHELDLMRRAATISTAAHCRAMKFAGAGKFEFEVEAEILHEFNMNGARHPAYTSIVAGGANACTLHYIDNHSILHDGDLLLIDAGCEFEGYAADITRTFPVNGKFSPAQKDVYQIVLAAQTAAIACAKVGFDWGAPHDAALRVLAQGFIDIKLCHGTIDAVIETGSYKQFYMHRTGHWLGMDVHDVGDYKLNDTWRLLEPGMVMTVEPGCYIRPADNVPVSLWGIGIRIEDDVLITAHNNEVLTGSAPKTIIEIEALMEQKSASGILK